LRSLYRLRLWVGEDAIAPGAVEGDRIERVFAGRAQISGRTVAEVRTEAMAAQSIKAMIGPTDTAARAVFLASDAGESIGGQVLPIDNDRFTESKQRHYIFDSPLRNRLSG
jgi:NAD(P)-dependent dehydrogenase (short-subunit alcohol dehydrogenase family)